MVALSKPTFLKYTCYEVGHTWTPSCKRASLDVCLCVFKQAVKVYGPLYLIAGLLRKRGKEYFKKKVWKEIMQSTLFLTTNGTLFITCFCLFRKLTGFYFYLNAIACGIPACAVSLAIERKERRGLLAVYMGNVAIETCWRMLVARGYVKSIPNGEVLLFSIASAIYLYYFKKSKGLPEGTLSMFKVTNGFNPEDEMMSFSPSHLDPKCLQRKLFGSDEICERSLENETAERQGTSHRQSNGDSRDSRRGSYRGQPVYAQLVERLKRCPSHRLCQHKHSCCSYILQGTLRMFGIGYVIQAGFRLVGSLHKVFKQPKSVIQALVNKTNLQLGAFLGCFVGIYRAVNCLLRWVREKDESVHGLLAGFLAGWSLLFYKSQTIALYTAAKVAELLYFKGIERNIVPYIRCADIIIYSVSTALVFHAAVLEPHNLRPAYWNFLLKVTENRFATMNRRLLDPYVENCSKIAPNFWPDYDMRYTDLVKPS